MTSSGSSPLASELWSSVDSYLGGRTFQPVADLALESALEAQREAKLPAINVAPNQGKMLQLMAELMGARSILEVGTLAGYSTIFLARALPPGGKLITLELDPKHAEVARSNLDRAGFHAEVVDVRVGKAADLMRHLEGPYDLIFIDADKPSNPIYFTESLRIIRPGGLIIIDNVVRDGKVIQSDSTDDRVQGTRQMFDLIQAAVAAGRVSATAVQTVGSKGWDGFCMLRFIH